MLLMFSIDSMYLQQLHDLCNPKRSCKSRLALHDAPLNRPALEHHRDHGLALVAERVERLLHRHEVRRQREVHVKLRPPELLDESANLHRIDAIEQQPAQEEVGLLGVTPCGSVRAAARAAWSGRGSREREKPAL